MGDGDVSSAELDRVKTSLVSGWLRRLDNLLNRALGKPEAWVELTSDDYTFDGRQEVQLAGDHLLALLAPARERMRDATGAPHRVDRCREWKRWAPPLRSRANPAAGGVCGWGVAGRAVPRAPCGARCQSQPFNRPR